MAGRAGLHHFNQQRIVIAIRRNGNHPLYMTGSRPFVPQLLPAAAVKPGIPGLQRFVQGLAKKLLLANSMGAIADTVFSLTRLWHTQYLVPAALAWVGAAAYMLQIYLDFSAYSDIAIGLGGMFGFSFCENFNYPYIADSINEFWRRWHISLTRWFREYLYFPLGGSRTRNADFMVRNLLIVWLCTGIWHGANWTFVLWGLWNFLFAVLERVTGFDE